MKLETAVTRWFWFFRHHSWSISQSCDSQIFLLKVLEMCHWLTNEHFPRVPPSTTGKSCRGSSGTLKTHPLHLAAHFLFIPMFKPPGLLVHLLPVKMLLSICVIGHYLNGMRSCVCVGVFNSAIQLCHGSNLQQAQEDISFAGLHLHVLYLVPKKCFFLWSCLRCRVVICRGTRRCSLSRNRNVNSGESRLQWKESRKEELGISSFRLSNLCLCACATRRV